MPFIPLWDKNPRIHIKFQHVTVGIMLLCALVHLLLSGHEPERLMVVFTEWGVVANRLFAPAETGYLANLFTLISSQFLHADWFHLLGNLLFLWVFGDNIEDEMGHGRFLLFYLLCGSIAAVAESLAYPASTIPLIGASGAVSGILGAYIVLHPRAKILVLFFLRIPLYLPSWLVLAIWVGYQFVMMAIEGRTASVAWWAHIGGFIAGIGLAFVLTPGRGFTRRQSAYSLD